MDILEILKTVQHPGKGDKNLVELGMVGAVSETPGKVEVELLFPKNRDPLAEYLIGSARAALYRALPAGTEIVVTSKVAAAEPKPISCNRPARLAFLGFRPSSAAITAQRLAVSRACCNRF